LSTQIYTIYFTLTLCEFAAHRRQPLQFLAARGLSCLPLYLSQRLASTSHRYRPPAAGLCNSTGNVATIQQLRDDIIAHSGATDATIFCVDTPAAAGRRLFADTDAVYTASVCTPDRNYNLPRGERTGDAVGCVKALPPVSASADLLNGGRPATPRQPVGCRAQDTRQLALVWFPYCSCLA
jgi:hypothetical protein